MTLQPLPEGWESPSSLGQWAAEILSSVVLSRQDQSSASCNEHLQKDHFSLPLPGTAHEKKLQDTNGTSAIEAAGVSSPGEVPLQYSVIQFHSRQSKFKAPITWSKKLSYPSPLSPSTCVSGVGLTRTGADMPASHHANTMAAKTFQHKADCKEKSMHGESIPR